MMRRIIENSHGHPLKNEKILQFKNLSCAACSQGKFMTKSSLTKVGIESPTFLECIQVDICEYINPLCGPLRFK